MCEASQHTYLILTKHPDILAKHIRNIEDWNSSEVPHIWFGVTAENQEQADKRIPILLQTPTAVRFVSVEPMLGSIDFTRIGGDQFGWGRLDALNGLRYIRANALENGCEWENTPCTKLDWVICGGESGPGARPIHPDWVRSLRDQCQAAQAAGVPFLFKQWGEWYASYRMPMENLRKLPRHVFDDAVTVFKTGKKAAGRLLDGRTWDELPGVVNADAT